MSLGEHLGVKLEQQPDEICMFNIPLLQIMSRQVCVRSIIWALCKFRDWLQTP